MIYIYVCPVTSYPLPLRMSCLRRSRCPLSAVALPAIVPAIACRRSVRRACSAASFPVLHTKEHASRVRKRVRSQGVCNGPHCQAGGTGRRGGVVGQVGGGGPLGGPSGWVVGANRQSKVVGARRVCAPMIMPCRAMGGSAPSTPNVSTTLAPARTEVPSPSVSPVISDSEPLPNAAQHGSSAEQSPTTTVSGGATESSASIPPTKPRRSCRPAQRPADLPRH